MGTHPIFESDFDCLTEQCWTSTVSLKFARNVAVFSFILTIKKRKSGEYAQNCCRTVRRAAKNIAARSTFRAFYFDRRRWPTADRETRLSTESSGHWREANGNVPY